YCEGGMTYEQTRHGGGFEPLYSRRRSDLQRGVLARHFLADYHARLLARHRRIIGLGLPSYSGLHGLFVCQKGRDFASLAQVLRSEFWIKSEILNIKFLPHYTSH